MKFTPREIIALSVLLPASFFGLSAAEERPPSTPSASIPAARGNLQPVELGKIGWGGDFEAANVESKQTGRPLMVLFDEVPGCSGCQTYGKELLSHPLLVEAAETLFVPVFIRNNDPDKNSADSKLLQRFKEQAWNYPVVRFIVLLLNPTTGRN